MKCSIFYAWQSQLPNATNRSLIKSAIEQAAKAISMDASIEVRPEIDHDTAGVPGSPSIADTIRAKIDAAEVVVCDVSIVQGLDAKSDRERPSPNANVLVELGYALKSLGSLERVVLVMNTAYGGPEDLPFDLRGWRIASYVAREGDVERGEVRRTLAKKLEETFRAVLTQPVRLPATPIERLARLAAGTKVNLAYTVPRSTQPHDRFQVEVVGVDYAANVWQCLLLSGSKPGTAEHIPLGDVEEVWTANGTTFVRLVGFMEHTPLEPYRYKSRSRSGQNDPLPVRDGGLPGVKMSDDAAEIMHYLAREYVKAEHPNWRVWNFSFPNDYPVAKELMALGFIAMFGSKGMQTTDWRLAQRGHDWIMEHRDL